MTNASFVAPPLRWRRSLFFRVVLLCAVLLICLLASVIVITHRPSLLDGADKLLVLRSGNVELFGPRSDVLARILPPGPAVGRLPAGAPAARLQVLGQNT